MVVLGWKGTMAGCTWQHTQRRQKGKRWWWSAQRQHKRVVVLACLHRGESGPMGGGFCMKASVWELGCLSL